MVKASDYANTVGAEPAAAKTLSRFVSLLTHFPLFNRTSTPVPTGLIPNNRLLVNDCNFNPCETIHHRAFAKTALPEDLGYRQQKPPYWCHGETAKMENHDGHLTKILVGPKKSRLSVFIFIFFFKWI